MLLLGVLQLFFLINLQGLFVQCLIPSLAVRKLDRKVIQRKRQDTVEMCRMFNSENERLKLVHKSRDFHKRAKRTAEFGNPLLNADDVRRIETIVDRLYDDVEENGQTVVYRQKILNTSTTKTRKEPVKEAGRRHNFAPAILLGPDDKDRPPTNHTESGELVRIPWQKKWKHGVIPYFIDSRAYDSDLSGIIRKAFDYFEKATCIRLQRLRERPTDKDSLQNVEWIYITNPEGVHQCVHSNEKKPNKGVQVVVFGYDCMSMGEILHEVMHVLGYSHEHTRSDRDKHVSVMWDNIKPGYKKYFQLRTEDMLMNLPYDYDSVLHYPQRAFSKNGQITLKVESGIKLGQRQALSEIDAEKVSMIYGVECLERNKEYLLTTCPSVVKSKKENKNISQEDIEDYFKNRIWPYGIVNYKIRDKTEFSAEEKENIYAVIQHIEQETCIEFRDFTKNDEGDTKPDDGTTEATTNANENQETTVEPGGNVDKSTTPEDNQTETDIISSEDIKNNELFSENSEERSQAPKTDAAEDLKKVIRKRELRKLKPSANPASPSRRHAAHSLVLTRSARPGCACPNPGRPDGDKVIEINSDCFNSVNDLLHLFVHILGLDHQHNMYDRDSYLHIVWDKLSPDVKNDMQQKLPPAASVGFPYDYQSVMHYPWLEIKKGVTNIMYPIWNDGWGMGQWQGLSSTDVHKLNLIYLEQCAKRKEYAEAYRH